MVAMPKVVYRAIHVVSLGSSICVTDLNSFQALCFSCPSEVIIIV